MRHKDKFHSGDTIIIDEIMRVLSEYGPLERVELEIKNRMKLQVIYSRASEDASEPSDDTHDADEDCRRELERAEDAEVS